jgi:hypothetical protein
MVENIPWKYSTLEQVLAFVPIIVWSDLSDPNSVLHEVMRWFLCPAALLGLNVEKQHVKSRVFLVSFTSSLKSLCSNGVCYSFLNR